jgi:hypothetical protein
MKPLTGIIDLHIHTAPDVRPRMFTDAELVRLARENGAAGVTLKSHHCATVERAHQAGLVAPEVRVMGGIVLNHSAGGLDPLVVESVCVAGGRIIWLPTLDAANHRRHEGKPGGIEIAEDGRLVPALREIIRIIARYDTALATGHLAPAEIRQVVYFAAEAGVRRIIINHPEHRVVGLSISAQAELARSFPVYFERCYAQPIGGGRYATNLAANVTAIRALGPETTVLATDSGQIESAPWDQAWKEILAHLLDQGIRPEWIELMTRTNPAFLCGMAEAVTPLPLTTQDSRPS